MQCVDACEKVQADTKEFPLLKMLDDQCALNVSMRDFGKKPDIPGGCFKDEG